ncbi:hypothetical protein NSK_001933 [Nannochloropsis salina CCMP1776]|uniref:Uncharacterized protein n=1 Tax=Nannochloropsis salina CCMP1776 TaxID=1027361 RepID=A0A4D9DBK8_9STRA|nr:hypothetical protein NSK_001933 [Nannochloropsis salina CCMP1776]|eukprot:TFJ86845.1 hypothetical protein NSK_001933 [Nannochloropsis salina CCMP1776]
MADECRDEEVEIDFMISSSSSSGDGDYSERDDEFDCREERLSEGHEEDERAFYTPFTSIKGPYGRDTSRFSQRNQSIIFQASRKLLFEQASSTMKVGDDHSEEDNGDWTGLHAPPCRPFPSPTSPSAPFAPECLIPDHLPADPTELHLTVSELAVVLRASEAERKHLGLTVQALRAQESQLLTQIQGMAKKQHELEEHLLLHAQTEHGSDGGEAEERKSVTLELLRGQMLETARLEVDGLKAALEESQRSNIRVVEEQNAGRNEVGALTEALKAEIKRLASQLASKAALECAAKREAKEWESRAQMEAERADELERRIEEVQCEIQRAERQQREEERRRLAVEATQEQAKAMARNLEDRLQQAHGDLLEAQTQLRNLEGELEAERRAGGGADAGQALALQMDALANQHRREIAALEEEVDRLRAEMAHAEISGMSDAMKTPLRPPARESGDSGRSALCRGAAQYLISCSPSPHGAQLSYLGLQDVGGTRIAEKRSPATVEGREMPSDCAMLLREGEREEGEERTCAGVDTTRSQSDLDDRSLLAQQIVREQALLAQQEKERQTWRREMEALKEERDQLQQVAPTLSSFPPSSSALEELKSLRRKAQEDRERLGSNARLLRFLTEEIGRGDVDLGGDDRPWEVRWQEKEDEEGDEGEEILPPEVRDLLEAVSRWAALWKARAWEEVKGEVMDLEETRWREKRIEKGNADERDERNDCDGASKLHEWRQTSSVTEEETTVVLTHAARRRHEQQATPEHELMIAVWRARVTSLEVAVEEKDRMLQQALEEANRVKLVQETALKEAESAYEKDLNAHVCRIRVLEKEVSRLEREAQLETIKKGQFEINADEVTAVVTDAVNQAKESWYEDERRRLDRIYLQFDQEKAAKDRRWREKFQEVGSKVQSLQYAFTELTKKTKEKEREAVQAAQILADREEREEEMRARLEQLDREVLLKDVTVRELKETLRREHKQILANAAAAKEAAEAEVLALKKRMGTEHEKEMNVVILSVRKHMREKYKMKVLGIRQAWEEERRDLLLQIETVCRGRKHGHKPSSSGDPLTISDAKRTSTRAIRLNK